MTGRSIRIPDNLWWTAEAMAEMEGVSVSKVLRRALKSLTWQLHRGDDPLCPTGHDFVGFYDETPNRGETVTCLADLGRSVPCGHTFVWGGREVLEQKLRERGNGEAGEARATPAS